MINFPTTGTPYSCIGKGGVYNVVGVPIGAGLSKTCEDIIVYCDAETGELFWRFLSDFWDRMEKIDGENTEEAIRAKTRY